MSVRWTRASQRDLERVFNFLARTDRAIAERGLNLLLAAAKRIPNFPRAGLRLPRYAPREVRRLIIEQYELRYELRDLDVYVLRIWHLREDRPT